LAPPANWWYRATGLALPEVEEKPFAEEVHGRVIAVDSRNGLISINLGSDQGLQKGHALEVYRLKPRPVYVGTLRVLDVTPSQSVGKLTGRFGKAQKDDEVSSKISGTP
jgi:hypothetical protein